MSLLILFAPVKILLQHSEDEWASILGRDFLVYSDMDGKELLLEKFPTLYSSFRLYENFSESAIVELEALAAAKKFGARAVIALAEVDLLRVARIKDRLHGSMTRYEESTLLYRDKFLMKQRLAQHGIAINPMSIVSSACDVQDFVERYGYPIVVKPRDGRGSGGVCVLHNNIELHEYLQNQNGTTFLNLMVEKYINAPLLNVNGLYVNGRPIIISPVRSTVTCLDFMAGQSLGFQMLSLHNPLHKRCVELTRRIVEHALPPLGTMMFHLEVFIDGDEIVVCEIACRLGGCSVNQELTEAFGINPRFTLIDAEMGGESLLLKEITQPLRLLGQLNIPPSSGTLIDFPERVELPFIRYCSLTARKGADYTGMKFTNGEIVSAIVEGDSEEQVTAHLSLVDKWVRDKSVWE
ncbi:ATP-grasp domain-containing protein [Pseudomonas folii]|uniref:ATP-grasp domain-containing protein n=1 Tax=Pseudomonas folii TaxID=2762593 RepID=A0ABR7B026_9PSED|nr:ATP-grasp domain-containing protein [Pseudomonas folii]MBC3950499.1 ATP-grasp domain-containing protein [Pseudomonas folii]